MTFSLRRNQNVSLSDVEPFVQYTPKYGKSNNYFVSKKELERLKKTRLCPKCPTELASRGSLFQHLKRKHRWKHEQASEYAKQVFS